MLNIKSYTPDMRIQRKNKKKQEKTSRILMLLLMVVVPWDIQLDDLMYKESRKINGLDFCKHVVEN